MFVPVFWAFTGRIELAFLPFFGTLAGVGQGLDVLKEISQSRAAAASAAAPPAVEAAAPPAAESAPTGEAPPS